MFVSLLRLLGFLGFSPFPSCFLLFVRDFFATASTKSCFFLFPAPFSNFYVSFFLHTKHTAATFLFPFFHLFIGETAPPTGHGHDNSFVSSAAPYTTGTDDDETLFAASSSVGPSSRRCFLEQMEEKERGPKASSVNFLIFTCDFSFVFFFFLPSRVHFAVVFVSPSPSLFCSRSWT